MAPPPEHPDEARRLATLHELEILDTGSEPAYDQLAQLARELCETPISLVSLVSEDRQWIKASIGFEPKETPRDISFCTHCILGERIMEVPDTTRDDRFKDNPLVTGEHRIRFYAGVPLQVSGSPPVGALCVLDTKPRTLTSKQRESLEILAKQVSKLLELRLANKKLRERNEEILRTNESLTELFQTIAHDLRAPFQAFIGITEALAESHGSLSPETLQSDLTTLADSASETYNLLENLLEWSKLETGKIPFSPAEIEASALVDEAMRVLRTTAQNKHIEIVRQLPPGAVLRVDRKMTSSILRNLIFNSLKFTPVGGRITLAADRSGDRLLFTISDNGVGFGDEEIEQIKEGANTKSGGGTRGEKGNGIGLHLVRGFLRQHGAELTIQSRPGSGSTVRFSLPLAHGDGAGV